MRKEQVLFLNAEFDVVSIDLRYNAAGRTTDFDGLTLLADLLHDVKAHDRKTAGI